MPPPRRPLPVIGQAAAATPASPEPAGDRWLDEITARPAPDPKDGVPVSTRGKGDRHRGRAVESKRGQQGS